MSIQLKHKIVEIVLVYIMTLRWRFILELHLNEITTHHNLTNEHNLLMYNVIKSFSLKFACITQIALTLNIIIPVLLVLVLLMDHMPLLFKLLFFIYHCMLRTFPSDSKSKVQP